MLEAINNDEVLRGGKKAGGGCIWNKKGEECLGIYYTWKVYPGFTLVYKEV